MKGGKSSSDSPNTDNRLAVRKQKVKRVKDPNKPKRPPSAFLLFMEVFRKEYQEQHPENKSVGVVGKAAGVKWRSMTEEEKAPYITDADGRKDEYEKLMTSYQMKLKGVVEENKPKTEVIDEVEDGSVEKEGVAEEHKQKTDAIDVVEDGSVEKGVVEENEPKTNVNDVVEDDNVEEGAIVEYKPMLEVKEQVGENSGEGEENDD